MDNFDLFIDIPYSESNIMKRKQAMYWGDGNQPNYWTPTQGSSMRLTPTGSDLKAYWNWQGYLAVIDPDTSEEVLAIWG